MTTLTAAEPLVEELMRTPGKAEIVNGEVKKWMPTGKLPGRAAGGGQDFRVSVVLRRD